MKQPKASKRKRGSGSVRVGLRAALLTELNTAADKLDAQRKLAAEDIHQARKAIRRTRACLRWMRGPKSSATRALDARLKAVRARLSALRDAGSALESIDRLRRRLDAKALRPELAQWRQELQSASKLATERFCRGRTRRRLQQELVAAIVELPTLAIAGKKAVKAGLAQRLERARDAAKNIHGRGSASVRHAGRRQIRQLALQLRQAHSLGLAVPGGLAVERIERLAKALGQENDLTVLLRKAKRSSNKRSTELLDWVASRRLALITRNDRLALRALGT